MNKIKSLAVFGIALLITVTIMDNLISPPIYAEEITLWDLELDKESEEISKDDFKSWMAKKGFESFRFYFFKREPKQWRLAPCLNREGFCLVMEDRKSSSHILTKLNNPIPLSIDLKLVIEFMVESWPNQTDLGSKDREDAALRIFLTADLDGRKVHLGLAVTRDHEPGQTMVSEREPEKIKYLALDTNTTEEKAWQRISTPIAAAFQIAFGAFEKAEILAIGLKSDGNNTVSNVKVWLRELAIKAAG